MSLENAVNAVKILYSEMNEADKESTVEIALNALKSQDKSEKPLYHKDIAQIIKQDLDSQRGYNTILYYFTYKD